MGKYKECENCLCVDGCFGINPKEKHEQCFDDFFDDSFKNQQSNTSYKEIRKTLENWNPDLILSLKVIDYIDYTERICTSKIDKNSNKRILKKIKLFKKFEI